MVNLFIDFSCHLSGAPFIIKFGPLLPALTGTPVLISIQNNTNLSLINKQRRIACCLCKVCVTLGVVCSIHVLPPVHCLPTIFQFSISVSFCSFSSFSILLRVQLFALFFSYFWFVPFFVYLLVNSDTAFLRWSLSAFIVNLAATFAFLSGFIRLKSCGDFYWFFRCL